MLQSMGLQRVGHDLATEQQTSWLTDVVVWQKPTQHYKAIIPQLKMKIKKNFNLQTQ